MNKSAAFLMNHIYMSGLQTIALIQVHSFFSQVKEKCFYLTAI